MLMVSDFYPVQVDGKWRMRCADCEGSGEDPWNYSRSCATCYGKGDLTDEDVEELGGWGK